MVVHVKPSARGYAVSAHKKATKELWSRTPAEVTVQPRERPSGPATDPDDGYGSLTPEELGEHALRSATQSGWAPVDNDAYSLGAVPASAAPRFSGESVASNDVWAETVDLAVEFGAWIESGRNSSASEWDDPIEATWSRDVDLNQDKVVEASLFDAGSEETVYEKRSPRVNADNSSEYSEAPTRRSRRPRALGARRG